MQDLVVKILPDIELAWRGDKPLLVLLRVIAGMALSQSYMFVELHAAAAIAPCQRSLATAPTKV